MLLVVAPTGLITLIETTLQESYIETRFGKAVVSRIKRALCKESKITS